MRRLHLLPLVAFVILFSPTRAGAEDLPPIRLVDVTVAAGLDGVGGDRFSFGDYDGDGDADLLVGGHTLLRNDSGPNPNGPGRRIRFTDVSEASGIRQGAGGGACWIDADGDGDLDAVTPGGALKIQVEPGRFEDRHAAWGLPSDLKASTVGVGDLDGDGRPDVLFGGGEDWNGGDAKFYARRLYRNVDGTHFEEVAQQALATPRYGRAVIWADFDRDGDLDVYLGNYRLQPNELLVNDGGELRDRAAALGVQGRHEPEKFLDEKAGKRFGYQWGHTIAGSWSDLDGDGDLDLWVSNLVHKFVGPTKMQGQEFYDIRGYVCDDSAIYRNDGAPGHGFTDVRAASGIPRKPIGDRGIYRGDELWSNAACGDLDGDGLPEVFVAQVYKLPYSHALLFRNQGGLRFEEISGLLGLKRFNSYGGAFADLDGDGDLDLICGGSPTPSGKRNLCVLRNVTEPGPWIGFRLKGRGPDTQALGAQVTVHTDKGDRVRQVESCMGSHAQQNESVLRVGLRGAKLQGLTVRWPGNVLQELPLLPTGEIHEIRQPEDAPPFFEVRVPSRVHQGKQVELLCSAYPAPAPTDGRLGASADTDGDGVFEPFAWPRLRARFSAPHAEVRVRLREHGDLLTREVVVRFAVQPAAPEGVDK